MSIFFWGVIILFVLTFLFYLVFLGLIFYWHETKTTLVVVPILYTFEFFIIGFLVLALFAILIYGLPQAIPLFQEIQSARF